MRTRCTLCSASSKPLSCARNITSNFKKYLEIVHKTVKLVAIVPEGGKRKRTTEDNEDECTETLKSKLNYKEKFHRWLSEV